ncbi:MAG: TlpA disulfide reductase family protein [Thiogranum sp.]|nr:TlpA disulfide reductase family protein [Thiogranum sp.]
MSLYSDKMSPGTARAFALLLALGTVWLVPQIQASPLGDADAIPHVDERAKAGYIDYTYANKHKAFAIAPGGAWSWQSSAASRQEAKEQALKLCNAGTRQKCILYAVNNEKVFDSEQWPRLWGPYANQEDAAKAPVGIRVGERLHDISYIDASGEKRSLSELKGKVAFVHFWGSWCAPCLREFPSLKHFHRQLEEQMPGQVALVLLQLRDSFKDSKQWISDNDFTELPLSDSGVTCAEQTTLTLADGSSIEDRELARVFPSSYVLDRNGMIIFSHQGPVEDWREYIPFFRDAVERSGR